MVIISTEELVILILLKLMLPGFSAAGGNRKSTDAKRSTMNVLALQNLLRRFDLQQEMPEVMNGI